MYYSYYYLLIMLATSSLTATACLQHKILDKILTSKLLNMFTCATHNHRTNIWSQTPSNVKIFSACPACSCISTWFVIHSLQDISSLHTGKCTQLNDMKFLLIQCKFTANLRLTHPPEFWYPVVWCRSWEYQSQSSGDTQSPVSLYTQHKYST